MTTWHLLLTTWHWHPSVLLGCAGLALGYASLLDFQLPRAAWSFGAGLLVLLIALLSPLHMLGDSYLFSAHMLQHLLLLLIVPPLLLFGIPARLAQRVLHADLLKWIEHRLHQPLIAWSLGIGTMWLWHLPALYNAALAHEGIHIVEHLTFLGSATIFWWPVVAPLPERRLAPLASMLYLFAALVAGAVLGIILTFAAPGLYPIYLHPNDTLGILPLLRDGWGLSPAADQQLGGLLMWVAGGLVYIWAILGTFALWYHASEDDITQVRPAGKVHEGSTSVH
jgi:putative membrane protein